VKTIPAIVSVMTPFPYCIDAGERLETARKMMEQHGIEYLPVTADGQVLGVLFEHQLRPRHREADHQAHEKLLRVGAVCSPEPYLVQVTDQLDNVAMEMARRRAGCVVVLRQNKLAGILTASDVCRLYAELLRSSFASPPEDEPA
jgi:CBS domain-containing protein